MMRRSGSRSHYSAYTTARAPSDRERVFESLQRRLAAEVLEESGSDNDDEEKRGVSPERSGSGSAASATTPALCRFFVLGRCRYGSHCTFSHALPAHVSECPEDVTEGLSTAAALVDCPFFLRGSCKYGEYCRLKHNPDLLQGAGVAALSQLAFKAEKERSPVSTDKVAAIPTEDTTFGDNQKDFTCGICFDDIVQSGKHFGLLNCDHCFCLECLRSWRQSKDMETEVIRACPACRLPSDFIVPSLIFATGEKKVKIVEVYKSHLALRECKYFTGFFGSCPFGPRCFYAHRDSEGRDVKHLDRPKRSTKPRQDRYGRQDRDVVLQSLLQQYNHFFRFFEVADWDDSDVVDENYNSDSLDDDDYEPDFSDNDYDTE